MHPADLHVHPDLWIRPMYCLQSDCLMRSHMALLRLTLSEETTKEDIDYVVDSLKEDRGRPAEYVTTYMKIL